MKYNVTLPRKAGRPGSGSAPASGGSGRLNPANLIIFYAIAVGITPEFDFMGIPKVRITDLLLPIILMICAGMKRPKQEKGLPFTSLFYQMFLWNLGCLFVWGRAAPTPGLFYLAKRLIYFWTAYAAYFAVRDVRDWNRVVRALVFTSPILSLTVLYELHANIDTGGILATGEGMRASGIIANQQTSTALYIAVISCVALGAWDAFKDVRWRLGSLLSLGAGCMAIFATGSRGGLASVILALVMTVLQNPRRAASLLTLGLAAGSVAWITTPAELQSRLAGLLPETQSTFSGIVEGTDLPIYGTSSITDRWLVAKKLWEEVLPEAGLQGLGAGFKRLGAIDDLYLSEWVFHGIIGLAIFVVFQLHLIVGCYRTAKSSKDPVEKGVAYGTATAVIVMSASGVQSDTFYLIRPMEAMSLLLGLVAARRAIRT